MYCFTGGDGVGWGGGGGGGYVQDLIVGRSGEFTHARNTP